MEESECGCDHDDKEQVDEVESEDQMTYEVAEDNAPDSGAAETDAEDAEIASDNKAASNQGGADDDEEEDSVEESVQLEEWANQVGNRATYLAGLVRSAK